MGICGEILVAGSCNNLLKVDFFFFFCHNSHYVSIDVDGINDPSIAIQKKVELWYQSVRPSSSPLSQPGVPSHPGSWQCSAASCHRQQDSAVSLIIFRDNKFLRDKEDVQSLLESC